MQLQNWILNFAACCHLGFALRWHAVAGTDADYRNKSKNQFINELAKEQKLLEQAGWKLSELKALDRWSLKDLYMTVNNAKFETGDISKQHLFRAEIRTTKQRFDANRRAAADIFRRQRQALRIAPALTEAEAHEEREDAASLGVSASAVTKRSGTVLTGAPCKASSRARSATPSKVILPIWKVIYSLCFVGRSATRCTTYPLLLQSMATTKGKGSRLKTETETAKKAREAEEEIEGIQAMQKQGLISDTAASEALAEARETRDAAHGKV